MRFTAMGEGLDETFKATCASLLVALPGDFRNLLDEKLFEFREVIVARVSEMEKDWAHKLPVGLEMKRCYGRSKQRHPKLNVPVSLSIVELCDATFTYQDMQECGTGGRSLHVALCSLTLNRQPHYRTDLLELYKKLHVKELY
jgi:hypothetical protein